MYIKIFSKTEKEQKRNRSVKGIHIYFLNIFQMRATLNCPLTQIKFKVLPLEHWNVYRKQK